MRKKLDFFTLIIFSNLIIANIAEAQRTVVIEPDNFPAEVGQMNIVIEGDTTETGARVDENTVYILKRDGVYWLDGTITNSGYHLHIEAEEGEGHPPVIRPAVDLIGSSSKLFQPRGDFTIRGVYLSHITDQGGLQKNPLRLSGENSRVIIDNCWFDYDEQSWIRIDNSNISLHLINSKGRNGGRNDGSGNGRIVDTRGIETDTIIVENNTFYNLQQNPFRTDGGVTKYFRINHNTFVDAAGGFEMGRVMELEFTNNLFTNIGFKGIGFVGTGIDNGGIFQFVSVNEIEGISDADRSITLSNNNFERPIDEMTHPDLGDQMGPYATAIQDIIDAGPDSVIINRPFFDSTATGLYADGIIVMENNIVESEEDINYTDRPDIQNVIDFMDHMIFRPDEVDNYPLMWDNPESRLEGSSLSDWRDFSYSVSSQSYTAAEGGLPLGDLNWFPSKKEEWENTTVSNEQEAERASSYRLHQNYPNPFNPTTNISFELTKTADVKLEIFDMLGRKVATLVSGKFSEGMHQVAFNADSYSSGIYIARLQAGHDYVNTIHMALIK